MRQALTKGVLSAAAATSILSLPGQSAFAAADAHGQATGSPGFLSGNSVQAPLEVPLNVCGNSVNGVGAGNPAMGNSCAHTSSPTAERAPERAAPPQREAAPKPAPANGSRHQSPGRVEACTMRRTIPSGFCVGYPVFSRDVVGTIVCHHVSDGSFPRAARSGDLCRPGAMYGSRSTASASKW